MLLKEIITKILEVSVNAPSGSNSQPWSFNIKGNEILVFAHPQKDHPVLNFRNRGTWLAHGALVENIKVAAGAFGLKSEIKIFPDNTNHNLTARIKLSQGLPREEDLFRFIPQRATNRKKYKLKPLTSEQKKYLAQSEEEIDATVRIVWVEDKGKIERLGRAAAANEIVTLEDQKLHRMFFDEIVWTKDEELRKKKGLFVKTMELKPPEEFFLKLFRRWSVMETCAKLGFARKIAASNAKAYACTPIIGLVVLKNDDKEFLAAGRLIERIWLKAAKLGFGFHLITGTVFFWQRVAMGDKSFLRPEHQQIIKEEYQNIADIAKVKSSNEIVGALFRIGLADKPSAYSSKKLPEIKFI